MDETETKVKKIIIDIMGLDITKIDHNKNLKEVEEWDSFNNLMVISEIEDTFKIKFTASDIYGVDTIAKIIGSLSMDLTMSWVSRPAFDTPMKTSAPSAKIYSSEPSTPDRLVNSSNFFFSLFRSSRFALIIPRLSTAKILGLA